MAATNVDELAAIAGELADSGRLARVRSEVDLRHELAGVARKMEGARHAVLFESVRGHRTPVLTGLYWNRGLLAHLLRVDEKGLVGRVAARFAQAGEGRHAPAVVKLGAVSEVVEKEADLAKLPAPTHCLADDRPSINAAVVIAKDPETGARSISRPQFSVVGHATIGATFEAGSPVERYLEKARRLDRGLWLTLNCGVGPALHIAASAPADAAPVGGEALGMSGALSGAPVELVPGTESDVEMVAQAMWALECEIVPDGMEPAGAVRERKIHVRRIHRRENPVFHTFLPRSDAWNLLALYGEARVMALLRQQVAGVSDVCFTQSEAGATHAVVQIAPDRTGAAQHAILAAFAAFPALRIVTIVDKDVDPRDASAVASAMAERLDPASGIVRVGNSIGTGGGASFGPKLGFDTTRPFASRSGPTRVSFMDVDADRYDIAMPAGPQAVPVAAASTSPETPVEKPLPVSTSRDYDTDRIWQRELAEWQNNVDGKVVRPAAKPSATVDWDESRWLQREMAEFRREGETQREAAPQKPAPRPIPASVGVPRKPEPFRAVAARDAIVSDDDEGGFFSGNAA